MSAVHSLSYGGKSNRSIKIALSCAVALSLLAIVTSVIFVGRPFLEKYPSNWSAAETDGSGLLIVLFSAVAGTLFAVVLARPAVDMPSVATAKAPEFRLSGWLNVILLSVAAYMTLYNPQLLANHVEELGGIAIAQEVLLAFAVAVCARASYAAWGAQTVRILVMPGSTVIAAMTIVLLVLLMEELSWGQHWFGWHTPDAFANNIQLETNIHNFYTNRFEITYYSGSVVAFVIMPFLANNWHVRLFDEIEFFLPPPSFGLASLALTGFTYEMWSIVPLQIFFFMGLSFAIAAAWYWRDHRLLAGATATALVASQFVFLFFGHNLIFSYEIAEMRELAIAAMIAAYSLWLLKQVSTDARRNIATRSTARKR